MHGMLLHRIRVVDNFARPLLPFPFRDARECRQRQVRLERGDDGYFWVSASALTAEAFAFYVSRVCQNKIIVVVGLAVRAIHPGSRTRDAFPRSS